MYSALIIDDEAKIREVLKIKLDQYCNEITIVGEAVDINDAYLKIVKHKPQLIFLDISMPGGNGFDLLQKFDKINFEIIFITGYNEYALEALKVSAVDYLLKPIKTEELVNSTLKAIRRISNSKKLENYEVLRHNIKNVNTQNSKVAIPGSGVFDFIMISDIVRCEGWNKYTKIILHSGEVLISSYNIGVFKEMFRNYDFYVCHKSHLVNLNHVVKYIKEGHLIMSDQEKIPLARRRREDFMNYISSSVILS